MENQITKKLQIKSGKCWLFYNIPTNYLTLLEPLPAGVKMEFYPKGVFDGIQLFVKNSHELTDSFKLIVPVLRPDTIFWITYPKKSSGIQSNLEMMGSWDELTHVGLRIVTSISIDKTWTALRFKPIEKVNISAGRNSEVKKNDYAAYIDIENKQVTFPSDMQQILEQAPSALSFLHQLSYSNKKEYVLWILTAKQEKTRTDRLNRLVEKLLQKKKNPTV